MTSFVRYGTKNMVLPKEGPLCYPFYCDFGANAQVVVDLQLQQQEGQFSFIQGWFLDNTKNANPIEITCDGTRQKITIPANKQAYMPQFITDVPTFTLLTTMAPQLIVPFYVTNVPVTPIVF